MRENIGTWFVSTNLIFIHAPFKGGDYVAPPTSSTINKRLYCFLFQGH